jgi:LuxR family transcriptional regulator, maltose regulon positive regulatory protein
MGEEDELDIPVGRRHIIERPRLACLLEETPAQVIMLVAPAGYGKTTLARQWLANRPHAWYQGSAASADVAALGIGITGAAAKVTNQVGHRFREWLLTRRGLEGASVAAGFLADDLADWPAEAWLAIDDYQWLTTEAEQVLDRLTQVPGFRLLLTSRRRPVWATPRKLLYGELYELGQSALAMSPEEANAVLADMEGEVARGLLALANGWPAVIGLAAFADAPSFLHKDELPPALHDYVAEELYASVNQSTREALSAMSLLPSPSTTLGERLLGAKSAQALSEGVRVGFLTEQGSDAFDLHPLLRTFLRRKLNDLPQSRLHDTITRATRLLLSERSWEGAFDLISQFDRSDLLEELLQASVYELLNQGLLATVVRFVDLGRARGLDSPILDLASAEFAFREGFHERARALAQQAGEGLRADRSLASRAFCRAGQSAYFSDDPEGAIQHFQRARELATDLTDQRSALWGHFIAAVELEYDQASELLRGFEETGVATIDDAARMQIGRLHLATRMGHLSDVLAGAQSVANLVSEVSDPVVRTSFWHVYAGALRIGAFYADALEATDNALAEIDDFHLAFAKAHVCLTRAGIKLGLGHLDEVLWLLDEVERLAKGRGDVYLMMNERTTRCRLHLLEGQMEKALSVTDCTWPHVPSSGQYAEFLACRAIALARLGNEPGAAELIGQAERMSKESEASNLCVWARSILALQEKPSSATPMLKNAFSEAAGSGMFDPFVFASRLEARIVHCLTEIPEFHTALGGVLQRVGDAARVQSAPVRDVKANREAFPGVDDLTSREREVFALIAESKTNKEIAAVLYLSEATVKVHVRHILHKLGVRTRTEAAVRAVKMQQRRVLAPID